jgi:hypothetical protein
MNFRPRTFWTLPVLILLVSLESVLADDALVLPEGRFRARVVTSYTSASNQFNSQGESQNLGATFSKKLNSNLLSAMSPQTADAIKAFNAVQPGLGDQIALDLNTGVKTEVVANILALEYGLSNRLSLGILLPIVYGKTQVTAAVSPDEALTQNINALPAGHPLRTQLETVRSSLNLEAINGALTNNFNYADGLNGWEGTGLGDLEVGAKYNWFKSSHVMASLKGGFRAPTGRTDNPDLLFDVPFGDGQWDLGLYHMLDLEISSRWRSTLELAYTAQLPDRVNSRIPLSSDLPLNPQSSSIDRDLGDVINAEFETNYTAAKVLTLGARYRFQKNMKDSYSASGQRLTTMEAGTSGVSHGAHLEAEYSNLKYVRAGTQRVPYAVGAFYRFPFAGENVLDSRTAGITLKSYF